MLTKEEKERYNRQIILPDFGIDAQEKMKRAELEGLIIEEKILKEKEKKLDLSST